MPLLNFKTEPSLTDAIAPGFLVSEALGVVSAGVTVVSSTTGVVTGISLSRVSVISSKSSSGKTTVGSVISSAFTPCCFTVMPEASASSLITTFPMGVPSAILISAVHPEAVTAMALERITAASADLLILPLLIGFAINFIFNFLRMITVVLQT